MQDEDDKALTAARRMTARFGHSAGEEVSLRIAELRESGELEAAEFWERVAAFLQFGQQTGKKQDLN